MESEKEKGVPGWCARAILRCHDACEELQAHADMSPLTPEIAKRTIAAMIQHFFTEILPVPPNPTSSKHEKEIAPWILSGRKEHVDRSGQSKTCARSVARYCRKLHSCGVLLPRDRSTQGALIVTNATLLAHADAVRDVYSRRVTISLTLTNTQFLTGTSCHGTHRISDGNGQGRKDTKSTFQTCCREIGKCS